MKQWDIIYEYCMDHPNCGEHGYYRVSPPKKPSPVRRFLKHSYGLNAQQILGLAFLALGLGGFLGPLIPTLRLEGAYALSQVLGTLETKQEEIAVLPASVPVVLEPLVTPDGAAIDPINEEFAIIVPKVGINAPVIANVDPVKPDEYKQALETGVAHASTSFLPNEDGTVYLFSHSTNYDWFVKDLNAVFYLLKNLEEGDMVVIMYQGKRYTYKITGKRVVSPRSNSYLYPFVGRRNLILQTCWPPGSVSQRLLIFADLVEENGKEV